MIFFQGPSARHVSRRLKYSRWCRLPGRSIFLLMYFLRMRLNCMISFCNAILRYSEASPVEHGGLQVHTQASHKLVFDYWHVRVYHSCCYWRLEVPFQGDNSWQFLHRKDCRCTMTRRNRSTFTLTQVHRHR